MFSFIICSSSFPFLFSSVALFFVVEENEIVWLCHFLCAFYMCFEICYVFRDLRDRYKWHYLEALISHCWSLPAYSKRFAGLVFNQVFQSLHWSDYITKMKAFGRKHPTDDSSSCASWLILMRIYPETSLLDLFLRAFDRSYLSWA